MHFHSQQLMKILCSQRTFRPSAKKSKKVQKFSKTAICISGVLPLQILFKDDFKKVVRNSVRNPKKALKHKENGKNLKKPATKTFLFLKVLL